MFYVFFEKKSGKIKGCNNIINEDFKDYSFIEVSDEEGKSYIKGHVNLNNYIIKLNKETNKYEFIERNKKIYAWNIEDSLYNIKNKIQYDLLIKKKYNNLIFKLNDMFIKNKTEIEINDLLKLKQELIFYITLKDNPYLLIDTITVNLHELLNKEEIIIEINNIEHKQISIYTEKFFEDYSYET